MLRPLPILFSISLLSACATAGEASTTALNEGRTDGKADLTIEFAVEIPEGDLYISIFNSQDGYDSGNAIGSGMKPAASTVTFTLEGLEPGQYAVRAFHDLNSNGKMDTNVLGIPNEPFAFSNNAPASFGPAKWDAANFTVDAPATVHKMEIK